MEAALYNCIVLLGPTAVGKTAIGVRLALAASSTSRGIDDDVAYTSSISSSTAVTHVSKKKGYTGGEVISADSRQVYRGLDLASGKDLGEYTVDGVSVPYHLIDICDINTEYSVFDYQRDFYRVFPQVLGRGALPVVVGGTGMYIDCIVRGYEFVPVPQDKAFRDKASGMSMEALGGMLLDTKGEVHGGEDLRDKARCIRAIEIARYMQSEEGKAAKAALARPCIRPLVIGTTLPREEVWANILRRLKERIDGGMVEEIERLHNAGASWERLEGMGLECKYTAQYIQGKIGTKSAFTEALFIAIRQFAKRQETWFRGMEKKGVVIHWLPPVRSVQERLESAFSLTQSLVGQPCPRHSL